MENYIAILIDLSKNTGEIPINRESISIGKFIDSIKRTDAVCSCNEKNEFNNCNYG